LSNCRKRITFKDVTTLNFISRGKVKLASSTIIKIEKTFDRSTKHICAIKPTYVKGKEDLQIVDPLG